MGRQDSGGLAAVLLTAAVGASGADAVCPPLLDQRLNSLQGQPQDLCQYKGKVVVVVNTASYCGFTPQYKGLEALYEKYRGRGLVLLGFPSNDFGSQEPGSNRQVAEFCDRTYKVTFPMFEKSRVLDGDSNPVYARLEQMTGKRPGWNFHKYVVDRSGARAVSFDSGVKPEDPAFVAEIESLLRK